MGNGLLADILRQIIAPDSGILLRREELQAALESARLEHPAEARYIDQLVRAVSMTAIGEEMLAARELDAPEREKKLAAIEQNLIDYVGMQTAPARLVVETFVAAIDWDGAAEAETETAQTETPEVAAPAAPAQAPSVTAQEQPVQPAAPQSATPAKKSRTKFIIIALVIIGAIAAFVTNGMLTSGRYASATEEYLTISETAVSTVKDIGKLSGDVDEEKRGDTAKALEKIANDLRTVMHKIQETKAPSNKEKEQRQLLQVIDRELSMLESISELLAYNERAVPQMSDPAAEKLTSLYEAVAKGASDGMVEFDSYDPIIIKDKNLRELLDYRMMADVCKSYYDKKLNVDAKIYQEQREEQRRKKQFDNAELKKKKEVVFLVTSIKAYTDKFEVKGNFYNGTNETISGVKDYLVDFTLLDGAKEVYSEKDILFNGGDAENMSLAPGASSSEFTLTHTTNIGKLTYTDYEVLVHKIHWKVRKIVKK